MEIEQKIERTKRELLDIAHSGHVLLSEQEQEIENSELSAARLMFIVASMGNNEHEALIPCAVGLELLQLGIKKHYIHTGESSRTRNLDIVSADYYYAQAISLATPFNQGEIVACFAKAIKEVAEAETAIDRGLYLNNDEEPSRLFYEKNSGIYRAAVRLGLLLGDNVESQVFDVLTDYAVLYAMKWRSKNNSSKSSVGDYQIDFLRQSVLNRLKLLPPQQRDVLANMVA